VFETRFNVLGPHNCLNVWEKVSYAFIVWIELNPWDIAYRSTVSLVPLQTVLFLSARSNCFVLTVCERIKDEEWPWSELGTKIINARLLTTPYYQVRVPFSSTLLHIRYTYITKDKDKFCVRNFIHFASINSWMDIKACTHVHVISETCKHCV